LNAVAASNYAGAWAIGEKGTICHFSNGKQ
jgi:hypothetical protein